MPSLLSTEVFLLAPVGSQSAAHLRAVRHRASCEVDQATSPESMLKKPLLSCEVTIQSPKEREPNCAQRRPYAFEKIGSMDSIPLSKRVVIWTGFSLSSHRA
ncbi:hypothetical protein OE88DRAFT_646490 [Heliocybe sulcata]|uniref:Uncharacterized protein n=1 Tax=Heliocybe sulcata TaxID=5364 RepID=A0A5C3NGQ5_9AGAM|nr:hypothetical protein OE88DRAFT_646490 [Heliocybe sulcata]